VRIAIVGSGVSGLVSAHLLHPLHDITLFEADDRLGGHAHSHQVRRGDHTYAIDTGFMVFNDRCYPLLTSLFRDLGIEARDSDMSFSVADDAANIEWCGSNLRTIFAQPRNLFRPFFWRMLRDILRFNKAALAHLATTSDDVALDEFLRRGGYSDAFREFYLIPMGASIWSANPQTFAAFPARSLFRFLNNHGLLSVANRPQWRTILGGSVRYVDAIAARLGDRVRCNTAVTAIRRVDGGVEVAWSGGSETFDHVILATHSTDALRLLQNPSAAEVEVLGAIGYQDNVATLHTDESLMPSRHAARASWNYRRLIGATAPTLTYDVSRLQGHVGPDTFYVTLNQPEAIDPATVIATMHYAHPVFDGPAMAAQVRHSEISGVDRISYAGAYWGYGFHEDGARSGVVVAKALGADVTVVTP